jgi:L-ascorbate metabolism protein UlaG (beta-lactamase superfamily)
MSLDLTLTHIGGPTLLIEVGGWRLLTDPTFDPPGHRYRFGWGTGSRKLAGPAIAPDALGWEGQRDGLLWISGDTVLYDGVLEVARLDIDVAVIHLGGVQFPVTGPLRYTLTATQAVQLCEAIHPHVIVPIHYEGWKHFRQGRADVERAFADAPSLQAAVEWLPIGTPQVIPR